MVCLTWPVDLARVALHLGMLAAIVLYVVPRSRSGGLVVAAGVTLDLLGSIVRLALDLGGWGMLMYNPGASTGAFGVLLMLAGTWARPLGEAISLIVIGFGLLRLASEVTEISPD